MRIESVNGLGNRGLTRLLVIGFLFLAAVAVAVLLVPGWSQVLLAAAVLGLFGVFFVEPFYFLLATVLIVPFSYLMPAGTETSLLKPLGLVFLVCTLPSVLWRWRSWKINLSPLGTAVAVFILGCVLSIYSFVEPEKSFWGVLFFVGNALFYAAVVKLVDSERQLSWVVTALMLMLGISASWGLLQRLSTAQIFRLTGTVGDPNYFAAMLLPGVPLFLYQFWQPGRIVRRLLFAFLALAAIVVIAFTASRGATISLFPLLILLFLHNRRPGQLLLFAGVAVLIVLVVLPYYHGFSLLKWERIAAHARSASLTFRWSFVISGWRMFIDHPLLGVGADNFINVFHRYSLMPPLWRAMSAHNTYIEVLTGTGLAGAVPFLFVLGIALRNFWRAARRFRALGDEAAARRTEALFFAFLGMLFNLISLTWQHYVGFWLMVALSRVVERQAEAATSQAPSAPT